MLASRYKMQFRSIVSGKKEAFGVVWFCVIHILYAHRNVDRIVAQHPETVDGHIPMSQGLSYTCDSSLRRRLSRLNSCVLSLIILRKDLSSSLHSLQWYLGILWVIADEVQPLYG
jgi:hypothetical protein